MIIYLGYRLLELIIIILPYKLAYIVASGGARLWFATGAHVRLIKKNISIVLKKDIDDPQVHRIAKIIFINWGKNIADFLKHKVISIGRLKQRIKLEGLKNLDRALKKGRGVIIFTSHIGNFEWGASMLGAKGYKIWVLSLFRKSKMTNRFFELNRLSKGVNTLYINKMLHVLRLLKNNEIVAVPSDWDPTGKSARPFDFFDRKASLPIGALQLALRSGAALVPCYIWRDGKYTHHQVIGEPVELELTGEKEELIEKNMKKIIPIMEKNIREHIVEWELFHDIWID
ncbi:MAG TPA: hypothetical protein DCP02_02780 [Actinobacteria bacterium]|nr:hypothetical protein [Actinomycetota bacterium]